MSVVAKRWMGQDATWYGDRLGSDDIVLDGAQLDPPVPEKMGTAPNFRLMSIVC